MDPKMKRISILTISVVIVLTAVLVLTSCSGGGLGKLGNNGADSAEEGIEILSWKQVISYSWLQLQVLLIQARLIILICRFPVK